MNSQYQIWVCCRVAYLYYQKALDPTFKTGFWVQNNRFRFTRLFVVIKLILNVFFKVSCVQTNCIDIFRDTGPSLILLWPRRLCWMVVTVVSWCCTLLSSWGWPSWLPLLFQVNFLKMKDIGFEIKISHVKNSKQRKIFTVYIRIFVTYSEKREWNTGIVIIDYFLTEQLIANLLFAWLIFCFFSSRSRAIARLRFSS